MSIAKARDVVRTANSGSCLGLAQAAGSAAAQSLSTFPSGLPVPARTRLNKTGKALIPSLQAGSQPATSALHPPAANKLQAT